MQLGWGDAADNLLERDKKYRMVELKVPSVVKLHTKQPKAATAQTSFGERIGTLDIVEGKSHTQHGTSQPGSIHMRLGSGKSLAHKRTEILPPDPAPD